MTLISAVGRRQVTSNLRTFCKYLKMRFCTTADQGKKAELLLPALTCLPGALRPGPGYAGKHRCAAPGSRTRGAWKLGGHGLPHRPRLATLPGGPHPPRPSRRPRSHSVARARHGPPEPEPAALQLRALSGHLGRPGASREAARPRLPGSPAALTASTDPPKAQSSHAA